MDTIATHWYWFFLISIVLSPVGIIVLSNAKKKSVLEIEDFTYLYLPVGLIVFGIVSFILAMIGFFAPMFK